MSIYDHEAIIRAYPGNQIREITDDSGIFDFNGDPFTVDQSKVDAARVEIDNEVYKSLRVIGTATTSGYPDFGKQLDMLYHDIRSGKLGVAATTGDWYVGITSVKTNIPKPS